MSAERSAVAAVLEPEPLLQNNPSFAAITNVVCRPVELEVKKTPIGWILSFLVAISLLGLYGATLTYLVTTGIGVWGNNSPVYWAWDITNFVWWIGIGHAGTLISAILFLFRQKWRTAINRFAEAMTVFAVLCALQFPIFHTGRPWLAALAVSAAEPDVDVAELPQPADVGRVRRLDVRTGFGAVLVCRTDS